MRSLPRVMSDEARARLAEARTKHGHARNRPARRGGTNVYYVWAAMVQRCTNPADKGFRRYGGRGIKVCDRWLDFRNFLADMGEPGVGLTLDRIDGDGNYEPSNCRWTTYEVQAQNRGVVKLTADDVRQIRARPYLSASVAARRYGVTRGTIDSVRSRHSWRSVQ